MRSRTGSKLQESNVTAFWLPPVLFVVYANTQQSVSAVYVNAWWSASGPAPGLHEHTTVCLGGLRKHLIACFRFYSRFTWTHNSLPQIVLVVYANTQQSASEVYVNTWWSASGLAVGLHTTHNGLSQGFTLTLASLPQILLVVYMNTQQFASEDYVHTW